MFRQKFFIVFHALVNRFCSLGTDCFIIFIELKKVLGTKFSKSEGKQKSHEKNQSAY